MTERVWQRDGVTQKETVLLATFPPLQELSGGDRASSSSARHGSFGFPSRSAAGDDRGGFPDQRRGSRLWLQTSGLRELPAGGDALPLGTECCCPRNVVPAGVEGLNKPIVATCGNPVFGLFCKSRRGLVGPKSSARSVDLTAPALPQFELRLLFAAWPCRRFLRSCSGCSNQACIHLQKHKLEAERKRLSFLMMLK